LFEKQILHYSYLMSMNNRNLCFNHKYGKKIELLNIFYQLKLVINIFLKYILAAFEFSYSRRIYSEQSE